ncbi:calmodulin-binding protein Sha1, putative [Talaromyces stipitatus ATCC 10500]|uniref:Calmodulin-binding protein Sha1, putative n=1 Tax=Talaromyces stipitatus (strain ATCC 10500 / CBS 375.48 / QM 6759 / NRRL 1006) TaxID=441959 RepID=B8MH25_TALSN|nr:calmodulin-binding protein Sha1, putative [Talaromyces stipitatus ATCC 10500]EED16839.1 calmodulin-binding protein Sha1, putative [Talaromyces stipitatus ATCC 10500]
MNSLLESPCPAGSRSGFGNGQYSSLTDAYEDDTLDTLEYTAAIHLPQPPRATSLTKAKPRRALRKPPFTIQEDNQSNTTGNTARTAMQNSLKRKTQDRNSSILAQPAQRFQRPRVSSTAGSKDSSSQRTRMIESNGDREVLGHKPQPEDRVRPSQRPSGYDSLKKDVRRRTVYIPTEDTTVPTVFMSLFSPLKSMDTNPNISSSADETVPLYSLEARIAEKKQSKESSVGQPRKTPLQPSKKVTQQPAITKDVMGKNGGKENIPPGFFIDKSKEIQEKKPLSQTDTRSREPLKTASNAIQNRKPNVAQLKRSKGPALKPIGQKSSVVLLTEAGSKDLKSSTGKADTKRTNLRSRSVLQPCQSKESLTENRPTPPTRLSVPKIGPISIDQQFPVLSNDISNPAMYEDNWLSHQEVVITQLVNGLFDSVGGKLHAHDPEVLRHELLDIYQSDAFLLLYKRIQASILYGALAPPKDILRRGSRLPDDLGMKKSFLNFWSQTYDLIALRAAAETVVGRKITCQLHRTSNGPSGLSPKQQKVLKRSIETFLETFLIRNMDKKGNEGTQNDAVGALYRRTLLRSIMIITLLDKARLTSECSLPRRLFTDSSPHKSSSAALQALANLLLPSMGDINRQVNHLNCSLLYKQHQLQDHDYRIRNLAVDLRDGVLLTRLVEILLYPKSSYSRTGRKGSDSTTTIIDEVVLADETAEWSLSQNLKFPCVSRAAKIFNVQIALDALEGVIGIDALVKEINAEHIVDGYREKTIALLWVLVGKWGLAEMLDWKDVRSEIVRLQKKLVLCREYQPCNVDKLYDLELVSHEDLLIKWASTLALLKGLQLDNLTTSFADGRIFESIVDEYEVFLLKGQDGHGDSITGKQPRAELGSWQSRLQALGCSSQFASLVAGSTSASRIFDRDFVLGALTFLCSRLLSSTRRIRAAIVIQKAWRRITTEENSRRRVLAKEIAEQCAAVACARERILWAKTVIMTRWRERKMSRKQVTSKGKKPKSKPARRARF